MLAFELQKHMTMAYEATLIKQKPSRGNLAMKDAANKRKLEYQTGLHSQRRQSHHSNATPTESHRTNLQQCSHDAPLSNRDALVAALQLWLSSIWGVFAL